NRPHAAYTVVGWVKTGMDAILWLPENGVPPSTLRWVMSRDAWLMEPRQHPSGHREFRAQLWRQSGAVRRDPGGRVHPRPVCAAGSARAAAAYRQERAAYGHRIRRGLRGFFKSRGRYKFD